MKADVIIRRKIYEFILFSQHMRQGGFVIENYKTPTKKERI